MSHKFVPGDQVKLNGPYRTTKHRGFSSNILLSWGNKIMTIGSIITPMMVPVEIPFIQVHLGDLILHKVANPKPIPKSVDSWRWELLEQPKLLCNGSGHSNFFVCSKRKLPKEDTLSYGSYLASWKKQYPGEYDADEYYRRSDACFARLGRIILAYKEYRSKEPQYLVTKVNKSSRNYPTNKDITLTAKQSIRWLLLCQKYKMLPDYMDVEKTFTQGYAIWDMFKHTRNQLHLYLCSMRYLHEAPGVIRAALYLHNKAGLGFRFSHALAHLVPKAYYADQGIFRGRGRDLIFIDPHYVKDVISTEAIRISILRAIQLDAYIKIMDAADNDMIHGNDDHRRLRFQPYMMDTVIASAKLQQIALPSNAFNFKELEEGVI